MYAIINVWLNVSFRYKMQSDNCISVNAFNLSMTKSQMSSKNWKCIPYLFLRNEMEVVPSWGVEVLSEKVGFQPIAEDGQ